MSYIETIWKRHAYHQKSFLLSIICVPLSIVYRIASYLKRGFYERWTRKRIIVDDPVITIGNLTVGGSGKTPLTMYIVEHLQSLDFNCHVISRAYGSNYDSQFAHYNGEWDTKGFFGDEVESYISRIPNLLLSIGKQRGLLVKKYSKFVKHQVFILDDALQYWRLIKDFQIILVHGKYLFGNRNIFPNGPLRENEEELKRAAIVIVYSPQNSLEFYQKYLNVEQLFFARQKIVSFENQQGKSTRISELKKKRCISVCSIAHPDSFIDSINSLEIELLKSFKFADHHSYTSEDQSIIENYMQENDIDYLLMTEKDSPKWKKPNNKILISRLNLIISESEKFDKILLDYIAQKMKNI
ncbi:MAG: tetraacyldisaccharide 4'-kinase [Candidatus Cloacimonadota bacterium]|nr:MAG: tetraacyldisaccharide 4'-kinase [Candidatus Cloacimonadota bacterium]